MKPFRKKTNPSPSTDSQSWEETQNPQSSSPKKWHMLLETRALLEWGVGWMARHWHTQKSPTSKEPVLLLPGMLTDSWALGPLTDALEKAGYDVMPWTHGMNTGPSVQMMKAVIDQVQTMHQKTGRKVHLVGWSLGGAMAYLVGQDHPGDVASVITFGSPLRPDLGATQLASVFSWVTGIDDHKPWREKMKKLPSCPTTSIVSKTDGVVSWKMGVIPRTNYSETIQVKHVSHLGMPANPLISWVVLDRLAAAQKTPWKAFAPRGVIKALTRIQKVRPRKKSTPVLR